MDGTWSLQIGPEVHSGLTLTRLETLVRSGTLEGHHLVYGDGKWRRVDEVPYLQRQIRLREQVKQTLLDQKKATPPSRRTGKVVDLFPEMTEAMLPQSDERARTQRLYAFGRVVMAIATLVLFSEALFFLYAAYLAAK